MKDKIVKELIDLGVPTNSRGILYWTDILLYVYKNKGRKKINLGDLYDYLAGKYDSTYFACERVVRYTKMKIENNVRKKYKIKDDRITIGTIINIFILKIF